MLASTHLLRCHRRPMGTMPLAAEYLTLCRCSPSTGSTACSYGGASASTSLQTRSPRDPAHAQPDDISLASK